MFVKASSPTPDETPLLAESVGTSQPPTSHVRWTICAMLFFATSINYMDRQVLGILASTLQHSIGWTEAQYGYIISAFQVAYALGLVIAGRLVDRLGSKLGYILVMSVWSLAAMAHALVHTALGFGIARFFLGLGESGNFPAAIKTTAEWFPQKERSLATGIFNSGTNVGAILAPALVPWVTLRYGWRAAFLLTGTFSLAWIVWWALRYRSPRDYPRISAAETAYITQDAKAPGQPMPWRSLFGYRQTWAFALAKFLTDPIWYFYLFWLPKFLDGRFHLGLSHLGLPLILVYNFSAIGSIGGGYLPTLLSGKGRSIQNARLLAMLLCASLSVSAFFIARTSSEWLAIGLLSVAAAAHQGWSANLFTTVSDMFPQSAVGAVVGIGGMLGSVGGVLFALSTGWILQWTGSYVPLFTIASSVYLVALILLRTIAPGLQPVRLTPKEGKT